MCPESQASATARAVFPIVPRAYKPARIADRFKVVNIVTPGLTTAIGRMKHSRPSCSLSLSWSCSGPSAWQPVLREGLDQQLEVEIAQSDLRLRGALGG